MGPSCRPSWIKGREQRLNQVSGFQLSSTQFHFGFWDWGGQWPHPIMDFRGTGAALPDSFWKNPKQWLETFLVSGPPVLSLA